MRRVAQHRRRQPHEPMTRGRAGGGTWLAALLAAGALRAQEPPATWQLAHGFGKLTPREDHVEWMVTQGLVVTSGPLEIRAEQGVLLLDRDDVPALEDGGAQGLPRREASPPDPRRALDDQVLAARFESMLRAARGARPTDGPPSAPGLGG